LGAFGHRAILVQGNFATMATEVEALNLGGVDGVLLDLGVSAMQLANPAQGFSFQLAGPLDMRLDPTTSRTAADLVNSLPERDLADLIYQYGEEPASRAIARAIARARPIRTTSELSQIVSQVVKRHRIHPATRTFQALRIAVNDELTRLREGLSAAVSVLKSGGRLVVITFHSLEDRIVKRFFSREARDCICPPEILVCTCHHRATLDVVTRKPIRPGDREIARNPRSRSAKLRIAAKR
jgi:16S rRNA (cytosine1402-N4)-methyltransferase